MAALLTSVSILCLQVFGPAARPPSPTRLIAAMTVNEQAHGDVFAVLDDRGDLWLPVAAMTNVGLVEIAGEQRDWFAALHVSLRSLAPDLTYELDTVALVLRLTAAPALFAPTTIVMQAARPPEIEYLRAPGVFVNYGATVQDNGRPAAAVEAGLSLRGALLTTSVTRSADRQIRRGLSSLAIDSRSSARRIVIGDTYAPRSSLGSSPLVAGVSVRSRFSLDPYDVRFPLPSVQGTVTTPAVAEIYVNDNLVGRQNLPPGVFQLQRLPARTGLGDVRVVVRDLFGTEQQFGGPYYVTSNVLRPGVSEYHYLIGAARTEGFHRGPTYRTLTWSGAHRVGVTPWLTLGMEGEGSTSVTNLGPSLSLRLWRLGEMGAAAAVSRRERRSDVAVAASYSIVAAPVSATFSALRIGPQYSSLSLGLNDSRQRDRVDASIAVTLGPIATLSLARSYVAGIRDAAVDPRVLEQFAQAQDTGGLLAITSLLSEARLRDTATLALRVGGRTRLTFSATRTARDNASRPTFQGYGALSVILAQRTVATVTHARTADTGSALVDVQRSLPLGRGIGYRVFGNTANEGPWNGLIQAQGQFGRVSLRHNYLDGRQISTLDVSGGLVWAGGEVNLSRRIHDGYALVRVPAVPGIRVYLNDQVVGHTNRRGSILVPNLLSYLGNPIRIADEDVPLEFELSRLRALVAPPSRGGGVVTFPALRLRSVKGRLRLERRGDSVIPAFGRLAVTADGIEVTSPVGSNGEFFLDRVSAGAYEGRLLFEGDTCVFTMTVPPVTAVITDLGLIPCALPGDRSQ